MTIIIIQCEKNPYHVVVFIVLIIFLIIDAILFINKCRLKVPWFLLFEIFVMSYETYYCVWYHFHHGLLLSVP